MTPEQWVFALANLVSPAFPADAVDPLRAMIPFLPREGFRSETLEAVAMAPRRQSVPALDEVRNAMTGWLREHQTRRPSLTHDGQKLNDRQREHLACVVRSLPQSATPERTISVLHAVSGKDAVAALIEQFPEYRAVCERRGWLPVVIEPLTPEQRRRITEVCYRG